MRGNVDPLVRVADNEALFREVNERIEAGHALERADAPIGFRCECSALGCNLLIDLTRGEYERVRAFPRRFVLVPGHELPDVEVVVERQPDHLVVEKIGVAGQVAERADPREG